MISPVPVSSGSRMRISTTGIGRPAVCGCSAIRAPEAAATVPPASVMPYTVDTPRRTAGKAARSRSESSGVTGEPPSEIDRTADRSRPGSAGSSSTRIAIVGTAPQMLTRSRSIRSSTWPESKRPSRNTIVLPPSMASSSDWTPPIWNSGPLCKMTSGGRSPRSWCGSRFDTTSRFCRLAMTERCASTAALARPVVPAVKMISAGSSSLPVGGSGTGSGGGILRRPGCRLPAPRPGRCPGRYPRAAAWPFRCPR